MVSKAVMVAVAATAVATAVVNMEVVTEAVAEVVNAEEPMVAAAELVAVAEVV